MEKIQAFVNEQLKTEVPAFGIGDGVKVYVKIVEGEKERIQMFEGTVIAKHGGGISETFTEYYSIYLIYFLHFHIALFFTLSFLTFFHKFL